MESHKRAIGILYIVTGALQFFGLLLLAILISFVAPFFADNANENARWVFDWLVPFINIIAAIVIIFFSIPSVVGGVALLQGKTWALTLVLILGCFKLFSFPIGTAIGTAIGTYTIWVYVESKQKTPHYA